MTGYKFEFVELSGSLKYQIGRLQTDLLGECLGGGAPPPGKMTPARDRKLFLFVGIIGMQSFKLLL